MVPVMFSIIGAAMLSSPQEGGNPVLGFLVLLTPGCVVSYGTSNGARIRPVQRNRIAVAPSADGRSEF